MKKESTHLEIKSSARDYKITLGSKNLSDLPSLVLKYSSNKNIFLISDLHILSIYKNILIDEFSNSNLNLNIYSLPPGEKTKSNEYVQEIYTWLIENKCDRHSCIIAFGGGVIGDCVGFVASTFLRGISLIQVPTTLLSMVDSSVGGKVGINHKFGKNLIGSFYPPHHVLQDISVLQTLDPRELRSGLAECVKHSLITSKEHVNWIEKNAVKILTLDTETLIQLVKSNLLVKSGIVEKDEHENNIRAYLNFGHTFGHAIEKEFGYSKQLLHGEGVALGMIAALKISEEILSTDPEILKITLKILEEFSLPTKMQLPNFSKMIEVMSRDKKNKNGEINFVLLRDVGKPELFPVSDHKIIKLAYDFISS